jgi:pyrroloquinoline quinone biosynthesis protein B
VAEFRNGIVHVASAMPHAPGYWRCSVAISADRRRWIFVNASPDLRAQLINFKWRPRPQTRGTPVEAILLTDADLDHTLGLFLLREHESTLSIHASQTIKEAVEEGLRLTGIRHEESRPILERIKVGIEAARSGGLPQSARTKAFGCRHHLDR